ncbi:MAG: Gfo/Idh/MocA family oxidoreductase [Naasia sp.]|nr:Gfo/Idh/MocA family oxidoreductase [Naasia sp.]
MAAIRRVSDLRAAVVGTGFIGRVHVEAIRRLGAQVVGLLGSAPGRAQPVADELGVPRVYRDLAELLGDDAVDVVHIASPNHAHFDQAKQALLAGKHVVCEKPLAMSSAETAELAGLARASGRVAAVNYNARFYPQVTEARSRVLRGDLGDLRLITGSYRQDWLAESTDWNWRIESEAGGPLRSVADIGSHLLDTLSFVTGARVTHVMADLMTFLPVRQRPTGPVETFASTSGAPTEPVEIRTDDAAALLVRFENGARGALVISQVSMGHKNSVEFEIAGSSSALAWSSESAEQLWLGHRHEPNQLLARDPSLLSPAAASVAFLPGGHNEGFASSFKGLHRAVYESVVAQSGAGTAPQVPFASFDDGHQDALIMDAILASAHSGSWTAVEAASPSAPSRPAESDNR